VSIREATCSPNTGANSGIATSASLNPAIPWTKEAKKTMMI
jgi:hypothetical protein